MQDGEEEEEDYDFDDDYAAAHHRFALGESDSEDDYDSEASDSGDDLGMSADDPRSSVVIEDVTEVRCLAMHPAAMLHSAAVQLSQGLKLCCQK